MLRKPAQQEMSSGGHVRARNTDDLETLGKGDVQCKDKEMQLKRFRRNMV